MQTVYKGTAPILNTKGLRIGMVYSRFNSEITEGMRLICKNELIKKGLKPSDLEEVSVPGSLEIPITLQLLATQLEFDALIAIGCVVRGETYHFELVSNQSAAGIAQVSLAHNIPIINAVLTVENQEQARARMEEKACDAACAALEMAQLMNDLGGSNWPNMKIGNLLR